MDAWRMEDGGWRAEGGRWRMEGGWNEGNEGEDEEGGRALRGNRAGPQASDSGLSSQKPRRRSSALSGRASARSEALARTR